MFAFVAMTAPEGHIIQMSSLKKKNTIQIGLAAILS